MIRATGNAGEHERRLDLFGTSVRVLACRMSELNAGAVDAALWAAERSAKIALLSGPETGLAVLEPAGGVLVLDSGEVIVPGRLREHAEVAA